MKLSDLGFFSAGFLLVTVLVAAATPPCKPKLEIGMSYNQAKVACPDLAAAPYDRDDRTHQVFFLCPSQHTFIVGDMRTTKMVGFMLTPEWQDTLVIRVQANLDSVKADFDKERQRDDSAVKEIGKQLEAFDKALHKLHQKP